MVLVLIVGRMVHPGSERDTVQWLSETSGAREIFSLKETVILYDLTNTYFEGSKRGSKVARRYKSKESRNDCPLITLSKPA
ncbi:hypothetical protein [Candidatus Kuenenia sp.]|uniref:hypothetical protein n=1 Tax=Candidatus Kuenenia sp. TaxID=2499824 RepID=UPI0032208FCB